MNLLITGAWKYDQSAINEIVRSGHLVEFLQDERDNIPVPCDWVEGVVCNGLFLSHPIESFVNLRYIQLTSAGYDRVPMSHVEAYNIEIKNAAGVYSVPIAETVLCGVLQLFRQSGFFYSNQKTHMWEKKRDIRELFNKNICIIGCGSVGTECAKRFASFACNINGVDINPYDNPFFSKMFSLDKLDEILGDSDVVVITAPLTPKTRMMFNKSRFEKMKYGSILVNVSRGEIVDTNELIYSMSYLLGGAVLDVFENEPLDKDSPLWDMDNVIIYPHNSFVGDGNAYRLNKTILDNLKKQPAFY